MTHVAHSLSYEGKYPPKAVLAGFGDSCYEGALIPMKSNKPVFVLLGMGDRALAGGYNWDVNSFLLGVDGLADYNQKTTHVTGPVPGTADYGSDVYGLDMKLGLPQVTGSHTRNWVTVQHVAQAP